MVAVWVHVYYHTGKKNASCLFSIVTILTGSGKLTILTNTFCPPFTEHILQHNKKKVIVILLVIAFILTIGVGAWIASAVLVYSKSVTIQTHDQVHYGVGY